MLCEKCGKELDADAAFCPGCGNQINPYASSPCGNENCAVKVNTWLIPSILSAVLCCLPFGIVAIVFAAKSNAALGSGDIAQAQINGEKAKVWFWVSFGVGIAWSLIVLVFQIFAVFLGSANA